MLFIQCKTKSLIQCDVTWFIHLEDNYGKTKLLFGKTKDKVVYLMETPYFFLNKPV